MSFAQKNPVKISIGPEVGLPIGRPESQRYDLGAGGSFKLEVPFSQSGLHATFTAGYFNYFGKKVDYLQYTGSGTYQSSYRNPNVAYIPVKLGLKYYAGSVFYAEGEAGISNSVSSYRPGRYFAYAPGVGVSLTTAARNAVDIGFRYESWIKGADNINNLVLRLAYKFNRVRL
ncbi:hypothetical protein GCM10027037_22930 [Mucilaginibacter koreensis]